MGPEETLHLCQKTVVMTAHYVKGKKCYYKCTHSYARTLFSVWCLLHLTRQALPPLPQLCVAQHWEQLALANHCIGVWCGVNTQFSVIRVSQLQTMVMLLIFIPNALEMWSHRVTNTQNNSCLAMQCTSAVRTLEIPTTTVSLTPNSSYGSKYITRLMNTVRKPLVCLICICTVQSVTVTQLQPTHVLYTKLLCSNSWQESSDTLPVYRPRYMATNICT